MRLSVLAQGYRLLNPADPEITDVVHDSRDVSPGALFCAIRGQHSDGHDFIAQAEAQGAAALLVERPGPSRLPQILSEDAREDMALLSARFFGHPSRRLRLIGITGTNGKTTTAFMLRYALQRLGQKAGMITTVVYATPQETLPAVRTTPEAPEVNRLLAKMIEEGAGFAIMEVSSHGVAEKRIRGLDFSGAVFTNLGRDHLDYHKTQEAYAQAKLEFFRGLSPDAVAAINADDPAAHRFIQETPARVLLFSLNGRGELRARVLAHDRKGLAVELSLGEDRARTHLDMVGLHNASNAAGAAAILAALGFELPEIARALSGAQAPPGRFQRVWAGDFTVIVDYAHTPQALARSLAGARLITKNRLWVVFGCGGNRDRGKRPIMGSVAEENADVAVVTTDNPRDEEPEDIIREIVAGFRAKPVVIPDRRKAIFYAIKRLAPGDVLVIAGKGHEDYQEIKGKKYPFSDEDVAREALGEIQAQ